MMSLPGLGALGGVAGGLATRFMFLPSAGISEAWVGGITTIAAAIVTASGVVLVAWISRTNRGADPDVVKALLDELKETKAERDRLRGPEDER